jgi:hypothetical protein
VRDIATIIRSEPEHPGFDAKVVPYTTHNHEEFLKDVLALANADYEGDRYIIIGLKVYSDGRRDFVGVAPDQLKDSAIYDQLVRENIEPAVQLSYTPSLFEGKHYGVFRISGCTDQPYLMKKQFGKLPKGEGWIRSGTSKDRLVRRDYDRIYQQRFEAEGFTDPVEITFGGSGSAELELASAGAVILPSWAAAAEIRSILERRRERGETGEKSLARSIGSAIGQYSYEAMTNDELEQTLKRLEEGLTDRDKYILYETLGHEINFALYNSGTTHVQDALFRVQVSNAPGLTVADNVYDEPFYDSNGMRLNWQMPTIGYPEVTESESEYIIESAIGDLRHRVPTPAFPVPLRIALTKEAEGQRIPLTCTLYGKNLRQPRTQTLTLIVTPKPGASDAAANS